MPDNRNCYLELSLPARPLLLFLVSRSPTGHYLLFLPGIALNPFVLKKEVFLGRFLCCKFCCNLVLTFALRASICRIQLWVFLCQTLAYSVCILRISTLQQIILGKVMAVGWTHSLSPLEFEFSLSPLEFEFSKVYHKLTPLHTPPPSLTASEDENGGEAPVTHAIWGWRSLVDDESGGEAPVTHAIWGWRSLVDDSFEKILNKYWHRFR